VTGRQGRRIELFSKLPYYCDDKRGREAHASRWFGWTSRSTETKVEDRQVKYEMSSSLVRLCNRSLHA
jgi:hypothetical protein